MVGERWLALMLVAEDPIFPVIYVWPLEWLNKITIVITKPILLDCQSGYGIFTFCGPIRLNSMVAEPVISRSFTMGG